MKQCKWLAIEELSSGEDAGIILLGFSFCQGVRKSSSQLFFQGLDRLQRLYTLVELNQVIVLVEHKKSFPGICKEN